MTDSERDLLAIEAVLSEPEERPGPRPKQRAAKKLAPAPAVEDDDFGDDELDETDEADFEADESDEAGENTAIEVRPVPSLGCASRVPVTFGVDVEADPELIAARERFEKIEVRYRDVAQQLAVLREKCGLAAGAPIPDQHKLHVMIANAIVAGTGTLDPSAFAALSGTAIAEKTLREAGEKVAKQVNDARLRAITRCAPKVLAALAPEMSEMARAWAVMLKVADALGAKINEFNAAGWRSLGGSQIPALPIGPYSNVTLNPFDATRTLQDLIAAKLLSRDDVAGLPGFDPR
ncbi:unnamed protein product [Gemmata massiliana]|uniref:Uncharacterized protein n=1 Tax=Gemmata massiliana TaxID=1210884 RepID=A0A6P2CUP0_9BACT|nr:hypothetical protein [Gemmata massiliana]VTR90822.1 unnamed protein product [Gemmata massiliana]